MWKRIIAPAVVVSTFWLIVGGATTYYLFYQSAALDRILEENVTSIRTANELQELIWRMHSHAIDGGGESSRYSTEALDELESRFSRLIRSADSSAETLDEQALVEEIRADGSSYFTRWRKATESRFSPLDLTELLPLVSKITLRCKDVVSYNERTLREASRRRHQMTVWIVCGRVAMLVIGPGLGLYLGFRLAGQLRLSMTNISVSLQTVAGDLEQEIGRLEITQDADLPLIERQLDVIAERMRKVVLELQQARREAMRAERLAAVGELAAGVAHELRNPLTSVKLLIQTARHRLRSGMPAETFDIVLEEVSRMETTIQGLLDFARPPNPHRSLHDLQMIVQRAVNLTEGKAGQQAVTLVTHFTSNPVWVNADAEQLHQVCINLILNGIESMTAGGVLDIHVDNDESASVVQVRFEDSGEGIPESILTRLFEPFVTSKEHGTGLGLAVSRRIVMNHAGRLSADNRPCGGAVLTLELPLDRSPTLQVESHAHLVANRR